MSSPNPIVSTLPGLKDVSLVQAKSPVNISTLVKSEGRPVRIIVSGQLNRVDSRLLGEYFKDNDDITVCISSFGDAGDLDFIEHFPQLRAIDILNFEFNDFDGLSDLPTTIEEIRLSQTRSTRLSLGFLERHRSLKRLYIESHTKSIESIAALENLEELTLRSITLNNLEILTQLHSLLSLDIKLGGTKQMDALPRIGKIRYLELWQIRGLTDLSAIGDMQTLQFLFLEQLKNVSALPSFRNLTRLRRVALSGMKGLTNLRPVADAPNLEELGVYGVRHLQLSDFQPFLNHPSLKAANIGLGSQSKNDAIEKYLNRPNYEPRFEFHNP